MTNLADPQRPNDRDPGAILLLVLGVTIVLSLIVLALANFVAADLRYSQVIDARAKTLSSAESGIDYAVDRLRLNQTLCATDAAAGGPVSLNGSSSVGTPLPAALNGTDTRITCQRLDHDIADVAGWAVVIADPLGTPNARLQVTMTGTVPFGGPVFVRDPNRSATDSDSKIELADGDLWYTDTSGCSIPKQSSDLPIGLVVGPATARGPECTTRLWSDLFSTPPIPTLPTNIAGDTDGDGVVDPASDSDGDGLLDGVLVGSCRVFSPGLYTMMPDIPSGTSAYFQSGEYHLDFIPTALNPSTEWTIAHTVSVWVGHAGPLAGSEQVPNAACAAARDADVGGTGATFYFDGTSRLKLESDGNVEMFARQQGQYMMSVHALPGSTSSSSSPLIRTVTFGTAPTDLVVHGLVWAPDGWFTFGNQNPGALQKLLGGIVVGGLWTPSVDLTSTVGIPNFEIRPATSTVDTRVLLTSTSTLDGVSTTVEAVVAYRPHAADLDHRVAVNSFRVVD